MIVRYGPDIPVNRIVTAVEAYSTVLVSTTCLGDLNLISAEMRYGIDKLRNTGYNRDVRMLPIDSDV